MNPEKNTEKHQYLKTAGKILLILLSLASIHSIMTDVTPPDYIGENRQPPHPSELQNGKCRYIQENLTCFTTWDIETLDIQTGIPLVTVTYPGALTQLPGTSQNTSLSNTEEKEPLGTVKLHRHIFLREHELPILQKKNWRKSTRYKTPGKTTP